MANMDRAQRDRYAHNPGVEPRMRTYLQELNERPDVFVTTTSTTTTTTTTTTS